ncbi:MAG TPA: hypothetical protein VLI05_00845 [Candidatus Saccharimonadia bacterium]|nr:hypothetical protein [Candidatus Saccharimonadia bacterium]
MAQTSGAPAHSSGRFGGLLQIAVNVLVAAAVWAFSRQGLALMAIGVVVAATLWPLRRQLSADTIWQQATQVIMGVAAAGIIALLPKAVAQLGVAGLYAVWRVVQAQISAEGGAGLLKLLVIQAAAFEAIFLLAAIDRTPRPVLLLLIWAAIYITSYQLLAARQERGAGVLAAAWALVATEASWVFLTWLVSYILPGNYLIVPQPALVLTALGYCLGSIYLAQRQGNLNRARLTEYLLIGLILIWIVIAGTSWRGTL